MDALRRHWRLDQVIEWRFKASLAVKGLILKSFAMTRRAVPALGAGPYLPYTYYTLRPLLTLRHTEYSDLHWIDGKWTRINVNVITINVLEIRDKQHIR